MKIKLCWLLHSVETVMLRLIAGLGTKQDLEQLERRIAALIKQCCHPLPASAHFEIHVALPQPKEKEKHMISIAVTNEQKVKVTLAPKTATGKPAKLDGAPVWANLSGDSTVEPAEDGLSAYLVSSDTPGTTEFTVSADANLGEGVETITEGIELVVSGAQASNLGIVAGTPEPK